MGNLQGGGFGGLGGLTFFGGFDETEFLSDGNKDDKYCTEANCYCNEVGFAAALLGFFGRVFEFINLFKPLLGFGEVNRFENGAGFGVTFFFDEFTGGLEFGFRHNKLRPPS